MNFLEQHKAKIDLERGTLSLQGGLTEVDVGKSINVIDDRATVRMKIDTVLNPRTDIILAVKVTCWTSVHSRICVIDIDPALTGKWNLMDARCVVQIS